MERRLAARRRDSVLKLRLEGQRRVVSDYFTPFNQKVLDAKDWDLGSRGTGAAFGAGGGASASARGCGQGVQVTLLHRDKLGKFQKESDSQIVQSIKVKDASGAAAYWNGHIFFTDRSAATRDFMFEHGLLVTKGMTVRMSSPGATLIVSADGTKNANSVGGFVEPVERGPHG